MTIQFHVTLKCAVSLKGCLFPKLTCAWYGEKRQLEKFKMSRYILKIQTGSCFVRSRKYEVNGDMTPSEGSGCSRCCRMLLENKHKELL